MKKVTSFNLKNITHLPKHFQNHEKITLQGKIPLPLSQRLKHTLKMI